jgi:hypothetical protein
VDFNFLFKFTFLAGSLSVPAIDHSPCVIIRSSAALAFVPLFNSANVRTLKCDRSPSGQNCYSSIPVHLRAVCEF